MSDKSVAQFSPKAITPTAEQLAVQVSPARVAIVEANAGASKTTVLALRMAEAWTRGTRAENIFALTYTEAAVLALKNALKKIGVPVPVIQALRIQTFEAFCTQVLRELEGEAVPLYTETEPFSPWLWRAVQAVADAPNERWPDELVIPTLGDHGLTDVFLQQSEILKGTLRDVLERDEQAVSPDYAAAIGCEYTLLKIYLEVERLRRANPERPAYRGPHDATYDLARLLLDDDPVTHTPAWPTRTRVLMVDEMHDMNQAMFTVLLRLLQSNHCFFCGVGDVDQVIHTAAGADARFMRTELAAHALQAGHVTKVYPLAHSFRFSSALARVAGKLADKAYSSLAPHSTRLTQGVYTSAADCADQVVLAAQQWKSAPATAKSRMDNFAVLLRHAHQSVQIENALIEADIAYTTRGFESYVLRPEVLFLRGLFAVATDDLKSITVEQTRAKIMRALVFFAESRIEVEGREHEAQQDLLHDAVRAVTEAPTFLKSFFDNQVLRNAPAATRQRLQRALQVIQEHNGPKLLQAVLQALQIHRLMNQVLTSQQRRDEAELNLHWLAQATERFDSPAQFFRHLNNIEQRQQARSSASHGKPAPKAAPADALLLASISSVKGLEFDAVLLPYLAQGEFPAARAEPREERNTFYVGMTRARHQLLLLAHAERPSEFVRHLPA
ncbi:3'-5' exonuclease [Variovorax sp. HJSM1_2]|uniref:3'-5' exonuclease n=1 Tax=Variovorax sp. HJSM1_2 TaxID=3366263 RepID=UPI003BE0617D